MQFPVMEVVSRGLAKHLVGIPDSGWAVWKWAGLRSAGFPASHILKLAAPAELGAAADQLEAALQAQEVAFNKAVQEINLMLDDLKQSGHWEDNQKRLPLLKTRRKLEAKQLPGHFPETNNVDSIKELRTRVKHTNEVQESFRNVFAQHSNQISQAISEFANCPRFREAVTWQNRRIVKDVFDPLCSNKTNAPERNSRLRQREEAVAAYLQRYCMKNDTIGFFGPVGWAKFFADGERVRTISGKELVTARQTYWETWAIEKLASVVAQRPGVAPWIAPIRMPFIRIDGGILHHPVLGQVKLTEGQAAVVHACNGVDPAIHIAEKLLQVPEKPFNNEAEVYACLREFAASHVIFWDINIPSCPDPERVLRTVLEGIGDAEERRYCLEMLDQLDAAKKDVAAAAGDAEKLNASFDHLESDFTRLTSVAANRQAGKTYAGRTLVYEDCRRDLEMSLGPELLQELLEPLSLLLVSGRWITAEIREAYRKKLEEVYTELVATTGEAVINATLIWSRLRSFLADGGTNFCHPIQQEFQAKWARVLGLGPENRPTSYSTSELRDRVIAEFTAGPAGWTGTRYHSPDIMIAAASEDAIRQGEYCFVLGELHVSMNTLGPSLFVNQHPSPEELLDAVEQDLGALNVVPVTPKNEETSSRMAMALIAPSNLRLEYADNNFVADRSRAVPISSVFVEMEDGQLIAKTLDGRLRLDAVNLVRVPFMAYVVDSFRTMGPSAHSPRISLDRLVIKRESWQCTPSELDFAYEPHSVDRYAQARKWRRSHSMPRFVFFKAPVEPKPCYLDFESPILVDIFCKMVRRTQEGRHPDAKIQISEMLPQPDQIWLADAANNRYSSEFRIVAVDLEGSNNARS